jgi:hypothetical protein
MLSLKYQAVLVNRSCFGNFFRKRLEIYLFLRFYLFLCRVPHRRLIKLIIL